MEKYGYLPDWAGRDQVGRLGNNLTQTDDFELIYFIKEPPQGIPGHYLQSEEAFEDPRSPIIET